MRDALLRELDVEVPDPLRKGRKVKRLTLVARALDRAIKKQAASGAGASPGVEQGAVTWKDAGARKVGSNV